ncbi:MAG: hypothetical protein GTO02_13930 [Candidatus Dadabacteria bacterium]|nr:hypothetical protein [Candidatus Dadabacteria bacterium]NIQ15447.1 hypothetical protein [Candidatus Dadabacteria bacterium]
MKIITIFSIFVLFLTYSGLAFAEGYEDSALSWQKQANGTRGAVVSVYEELQSIGDQGNSAAKDLINDAVKWLGEGDKHLKQGDGDMAKSDFEKASYNYNMAWQYYVKAATAGLNARRLLTGK